MEFYRVIKTMNSAVTEVKEFDEFAYAKNYFENEKSKLVAEHGDAKDIDFKQTGLGKSDSVLSFKTNDGVYLSIQIQAFDRIIHTATMSDEATGTLMNVSNATGNLNSAYVNLFMETLYTAAINCGVDQDELDDKYFEYSYYKEKLGDEFFENCKDSYTDQEVPEAMKNLYKHEDKFKSIAVEFAADYEIEILMDSLTSFEFNTATLNIELFGHHSIGNCVSFDDESK